ncbi:unnamed protein product, partial [Rotaria magnacalcarata]
SLWDDGGVVGLLTIDDLFNDDADALLSLLGISMAKIK